MGKLRAWSLASAVTLWAVASCAETGPASPELWADVAGDLSASPDAQSGSDSWSGDAMLDQDGDPLPDPGLDVGSPSEVAPPDLPIMDSGSDTETVPPGPAPTPITLRENRPHVAVLADGAPEIEFLIDTGSPLTALDVDHFGGSPASVTADITLFGVTVSDHACVRYDLFGPLPQGATQVVGGILGSELFDARVLVLDYRNSRGYLLADYGAASTIGEATASTVSSAFTREGGGTFQVPGDGTFSVGANRIILSGALEGQPVTMLLDTGAAYSVVKPSLFASLPQSGRPILEGVRMVQSGQSLEATMTRAASLSLGGATVESTPMVVATDAIFDALQSETGADVEIFLGGTWLRHYLTSVDFTTDMLHLAEFLDPDHINPDEWVGPGVRFNDGPGHDFLVYDVYDGTDAASKGVQVGWRLAEIDGQATAAWDTVEEFRSYLAGLAPGTLASFGFRDPNDLAVVTNLPLLIEELLPPYLP